MFTPCGTGSKPSMPIAGRSRCARLSTSSSSTSMSAVEWAGANALPVFVGEFPGVRAVLTTGYLDDVLLENHREHGFSGVITKPFNVERLVSTVGKLAGAAF